MNLSTITLIAALLIAIGSWGQGFTNWTDLGQVGNFFSLLGVIGAVVLAWLGKSPIKPKE